MAQIIGNSDGGGFEIGPQGIRPIPPWDSGLMGQFKALAALTNALPNLASKQAEEKLAPLATELASVVVQQVRDVVGGLDGDAALVYDDPEGGFVCGSTGQPPHPLPPRRVLADVGQLAGSLLGAQRLQAAAPALQQVKDGG